LPQPPARRATSTPASFFEQVRRGLHGSLVRRKLKRVSADGATKMDRHVSISTHGLKGHDLGIRDLLRLSIA